MCRLDVCFTSFTCIRNKQNFIPPCTLLHCIQMNDSKDSLILSRKSNKTHPWLIRYTQGFATALLGVVRPMGLWCLVANFRWILLCSWHYWVYWNETLSHTATQNTHTQKKTWRQQTHEAHHIIHDHAMCLRVGHTLLFMKIILRCTSWYLVSLVMCELCCLYFVVAWF